MNKARKLTAQNGCRYYPRPTEPLVNEWLRPTCKQRTFRAPRQLARNRWEHGTRRFQDAAWERLKERQAKELLALGGVTGKAEYVYDYDPFDGDVIETKQPWGRRWLDYVPLHGSREYYVARGDDSPCYDRGYFVPGWTFDERLDYYRRMGMPRHDAWERARNAVLQAAHDYLKRDNGEVHFVVTIDGEEYVDSYGRPDDGEYINCDDPQDVLELVAEIEGLKWIIEKVTAERAELGAGQVGPRE